MRKKTSLEGHLTKVPREGTHLPRREDHGERGEGIHGPWREMGMSSCLKEDPRPLLARHHDVETVLPTDVLDDLFQHLYRHVAQLPPSPRVPRAWWHRGRPGGGGGGRGRARTGRWRKRKDGGCCWICFHSCCSCCWGPVSEVSFPFSCVLVGVSGLVLRLRWQGIGSAAEEGRRRNNSDSNFLLSFPLKMTQLFLSFSC